MKILSILIATTILSSAVEAATFNVTRKDDPVPDGCNVNNCSLREAVIDADQTAAKDIIMLPAGVYLIDLAGSDNSEDVGDLDISTDMDFLGAPSTIDGQQLGRIMDIRSDARVALKDLTLKGANTSLDTNGSLNGGAVAIDGGSLSADNVTFENNSAQTLGGAIYARSDTLVTIDNCVFDNNSGGSGGAIFADTGITVRNTVFQNNSVTQRGAALYVSGSTSVARIEDGTFDANIAAGSGGVVLFLGSSLFFERVVATGNEATSRGGGVIFMSGTTHAKQIDIINSLFEDNKGDDGGVISTAGDLDMLNIRHSSFVNNSATDDGGAIYTTGGVTDLTNDTFSGNQALDDGGAIYGFGAEINLRHVTISGGSAPSGSALGVIGTTGTGSAVELSNTILDGDCSIANADTFTSLGGNVESTGDSCELNAGSDLVSQSEIELGLQPLAFSGDTPTHQLNGASVARGQGVPSICESVEIDQLFRNRASMCSSGADESDTVFADSFETRNN